VLLIGTHLADNQLRHHHRVQQEKPADRRVEMLCAHRARRPEDREDQRQHQHEAELHLPAPCRKADIVIAAVGKPELVRGDWLKAGATVLDVGINRIAEGEKTRLVGDVHFASAVAVAGAITPVPGGIGPMTIACLLRNTLACAKALHGTHD